MAFVEPKVFKYPAEDECLVRRLGSAMLGLWPSLPREIQEKIMAEAGQVWDREFHVSRLPDKLENLIRRRNGR